MKKIKLHIRQLQSGKWAAFKSAKSLSYYAASVRDTERDAKVAWLQELGREGQDRIDAVDKQLDALGALSATDPHGYLC